MRSQVAVGVTSLMLLAHPSSSLVGESVSRRRGRSSGGGGCAVGGSIIGLKRHGYRQGLIARLPAAAALPPLAAAAAAGPKEAAAARSLPPELAPITMSVFSQMLGEGIALSSLPLYLTRLGAEPLMVGLAISCFSVAQMAFAPILVGLSSRSASGRSAVLRLCLAGAAGSSLLIAFSDSVGGVIAGRALAGVFAACVPVAQSAVTDVLPREQAALGLSRVSASSQLGVVVGPAVSAIVQAGLSAAGLRADRCLPAVFVLSAAFAVGVLTQMTFMERREREGGHVAAGVPDSVPPASSEPTVTAPPAASENGTGRLGGLRRAQPMLRAITIVVGWTAILSNSIYGLFAPRFMGFQQPQLSVTYSVAAALMVGTQVVFPRIVEGIGVHRACAAGIAATGAGIGGLALVRVQPLHSALYMLNRVGASVADTATAALVARSSPDREARSRNLALLTSTRAAARIATPLLSSKLFELSCRASVVPGSLPFLTAACFAVAVAPLPLALLRSERAMCT